MILVESVEDVDALELPDPTRVAYLTQTTLSLDETTDIVARLEERFPLIRGPKSQDICYATENRQMAVKGVSRVLRSFSGGGFVEQLQLQAAGRSRAELRREVLPRERLAEVNPAWLEGVNNVGVTAGASAPEHLVGNIVDALQATVLAKWKKWRWWKRMCGSLCRRN